MKVGDRVRIYPGGASVFTIEDVNEDGHFVIESVDDAPGKYPFSMKPEELIPAE